MSVAEVEEKESALPRNHDFKAPHLVNENQIAPKAKHAVEHTLEHEVEHKAEHTIEQAPKQKEVTEDKDALKYKKDTEKLLKFKVDGAKKISSIDKLAKDFEQTTLQLSQDSGDIQVNNKLSQLSDTQAFVEKSKALSSMDDYDIKAPAATFVKTKGDPTCINGPCSQGGTWPLQTRYEKKPPSASLIQLSQNVKGKQNFIEGFDETNNEYVDETDQKI